LDYERIILGKYHLGTTVATGFGWIIDPRTGDNLDSLHSSDTEPESFGKANRSTDGNLAALSLLAAPDVPVKPDPGKLVSTLLVDLRLGGGNPMRIGSWFVIIL